MGNLHRQLRVLALFIAAFMTLVAGCGDSDESGEPTAGSGTSAPAPTRSTGTDPTSPTRTDDTGGGTAGTGSTNERADGSGCTPSSATDLPDGRWYGLVDGAGADELVFDLACWFTGVAAVDAAAEDGEESPPPNDYHVRNASDRLRILIVDPEAPVTWYPDGGDPADVEVVTYRSWLVERESRAVDLALWLTIVDGRITAIEEQWVP